MILEHLNIQGIKIEYVSIGEGIPLVFLHGMGGSIRQILNTCPPFDGVRFIIPNQQGHGNSGADWPHYSFDRLADDVIALLDHLEIQQTYLAGISMGAAVCLNLSARFPDRVRAALLIRNAWTDFPMSETVQNAYLNLGQCLQNGGLEAFMQTPSWQVIQSEASAYTRNAFISPFQDESCLRNWQKYQILPAQSPVHCVDDLKKLRVPTAILANRSDLCHPYSYGERLAKQISNASFAEIPSKDADPQAHNLLIQRAVRQMLFSEK